MLLIEFIPDIKNSNFYLGCRIEKYRGLGHRVIDVLKKNRQHSYRFPGLNEPSFLAGN